MDKTPTSPYELHRYNLRGFVECTRVLKPAGFLVYKAMDYVSSGKFQAVTHWIIADAQRLRVEYVDRLEHVGSARPQPPGRRQVHSRRNLSTLLVFRKSGLT